MNRSALAFLVAVYALSAITIGYYIAFPHIAMRWLFPTFVACLQVAFVFTALWRTSSRVGFALAFGAMLSGMIACFWPWVAIWH